MWSRIERGAIVYDLCDLGLDGWHVLLTLARCVFSRRAGARREGETSPLEERCRSRGWRRNVACGLGSENATWSKKFNTVRYLHLQHHFSTVLCLIGYYCRRLSSCMPPAHICVSSCTIFEIPDTLPELFSSVNSSYTVPQLTHPNAFDSESTLVPDRARNFNIICQNYSTPFTIHNARYEPCGVLWSVFIFLNSFYIRSIFTKLLHDRLRLVR